jgi:hypothetical protein
MQYHSSIQYHTIQFINTIHPYHSSIPPRGAGRTREYVQAEAEEGERVNALLSEVTLILMLLLPLPTHH